MPQLLAFKARTTSTEWHELVVRPKSCVVYARFAVPEVIAKRKRSSEEHVCLLGQCESLRR
jgi:hypothetical protein